MGRLPGSAERSCRLKAARCAMLTASVTHHHQDPRRLTATSLSEPHGVQCVFAWRSGFAHTEGTVMGTPKRQHYVPKCLLDNFAIGGREEQIAMVRITEKRH